MRRNFLPLSLALGALLLAPLMASADDAPPPAPTVPAPAVPKANHHVRGKITAVDAAKKTLTLTQHKKETTLTVADNAKIYKVDDVKGSPTGTFADLTVGLNITATTKGDADALTVKEIHIRAPHTAKTPAVPVPATPAAPTTP